MATLTPAVRRIGSAVLAGLVLMRMPLGRDGRRRRQEELMLELLGKLTAIAEQMDRMVREIHHANLIQHYRLNADHLERAIDDPALAAALSTLDDVSAGQRRQMLFVNRQFGTTLLAHRVGALDWDELIGTVRVLARNPVFAEYWRRTGEHRRSLPDESLEARVGRVVDVIVEELADDPDEWWVVGPTPVPAPEHTPGHGTGRAPSSASERTPETPSD
ncbi:DUF6082 family protein [Streptomyces sp. CA-249302]|uniref:DUF6082 family protein n=1 Tax=Streptomyces sp. CA-249302 TaxID=3240058 RepID=UPI003D91D33F